MLDVVDSESDVCATQSDSLCENFSVATFAFTQQKSENERERGREKREREREREGERDLD